MDNKVEEGAEGGGALDGGVVELEGKGAGGDGVGLAEDAAGFSYAFYLADGVEMGGKMGTHLAAKR